MLVLVSHGDWGKHSQTLRETKEREGRWNTNGWSSFLSSPPFFFLFRGHLQLFITFFLDRLISSSFLSIPSQFLYLFINFSLKFSTGEKDRSHQQKRKDNFSRLKRGTQIIVSSVWDVNSFGGKHYGPGTFDIYLSEKKMKEERKTKRKDNNGIRERKRETCRQSETYKHNKLFREDPWKSFLSTSFFHRSHVRSLLILVWTFSVISGIQTTQTRTFNTSWHVVDTSNTRDMTHITLGYNDERHASDSCHLSNIVKSPPFHRQQRITEKGRGISSHEGSCSFLFVLVYP